MSRWAVYPAALTAGTLFAVWLLSWHALFPAGPLHEASWGDVAVSVVGQRYLLGGPWLWPPLLAQGLGGGTNVALTDSIPLAVLLLKPFRAWLLPGATVSTCWVALMLALQPAAAVYALRGTGERRPGPAMAAAVLACSMPALLDRFGHQALCSHATILLALGLYARLVGGRRLWPWAALLLACCVLIHPYIAAVVAAVLAAVPLTKILRREPPWRAAAGLAASLAVSACLAAAMGYGGSRPSPGFGYYSMNLLGPFLPSHSSLFPDLAVDATGGQTLEGFQYLGAGMLLLCASAAWLLPRGRVRLGRHAGLLVVLAALSVFALSNRAFAGTWLLYDAGPVPAVLEQFRATSRFFWPVAYAGLIGAVAIVARALPPRPAAALLAAAALLQIADTRQLRAELHAKAATPVAWTLDAALLRPIFARHARLTQWPSFGCGADGASPLDTQITLLASETLMATNTVATARDRGVIACDAAAALGSPLQPGELRVLTHAGDAWLVPGDCRRAGLLAVCSQDSPALAALPRMLAARLELGHRATPTELLPLLGPGWSQMEPTGVWSDGAQAILVLQRPAQAATLALQLVPLAPQPGGTQAVTIIVGETQTHLLAADLAPATVTISVPAEGPPNLIVRLLIAHPVRPLDRGMPGDVRTLGIKLEVVTLTRR